MSNILDRAIEAIRAQPEDRQDLAGEVLFAIASQSTPNVRLSAEQVAEVKLARVEAREGKFATDESMRDLWKKFGV